MTMVKRTYILPPDTLKRFENEVASGQRSTIIASLIANWLEERERAAIRQSVIEGCRAMSEEYLEVAREWAPLDDDVDRLQGE